MKRINLFIIILFAIWASGCSSSQEKFFEDEPTVYFNISGAQKDSIMLSFAKTTAKEITYEVPIEIAGYPSGSERKFMVSVDKELSTAKEGEHYKKLEDYYTIGVNEFTGVVPVTFFCTDPLLDERAVDLVLNIVATSDFNNGLADRQTCRLKVSNILLMPGSWAWWSKNFGVYSKVKHKIILEQCGISEIPDKPEGTKRYKWQGYGNVVLNYCKENYPIYDENNQIIEPNWVVKF